MIEIVPTDKFSMSDPYTNNLTTYLMNNSYTIFCTFLKKFTYYFKSVALEALSSGPKFLTRVEYSTHSMHFWFFSLFVIESLSMETAFQARFAVYKMSRRHRIFCILQQSIATVQIHAISISEVCIYLLTPDGTL